MTAPATFDEAAVSRVMARAPVYLKTSVSIQSWASFCRIIGSRVTGTPSFLVARARSTRASRAMRSRTCSPKPRASRSYIRVVSPTAQPLSSPPRICDSGIRTLSKYTSLNSASPVSCLSGFTVTPGLFMSSRK